MSTQRGKIHSIRRGASSVMGPSVGERMSAGKALREKVPRSSHAEWAAPADRRDPAEVLRDSERGRLPELVPIRYGRMRQSPFAFFSWLGGPDGTGFVENSHDRNSCAGVR